MTADDDIVEVVAAELADGRDHLAKRGHGTASIRVQRGAFATTLVTLAGRFVAMPDREVTVIVEIDPARVGWRLEASLYEYLDSEPSERLVRDLGSHRVRDAEYAIPAAQQLARSAWIALDAYLADRGRLNDRRGTSA